MLDREYLLRRVLQEDEAARRATCEAARQRHEELAAAYRRRLFPRMEQMVVTLNTAGIEAFLARLDSHGIGRADRDALAGSFVGTRTYRRGQTAAEDADGGELLHLITKGWAARVQNLEDGSRQITDFVLPGELCDLSRGGHGDTDTVVALTPLKVIVLDRRSVDAAMDSHPTLADALMRLAFSEQTILRAWLVCLGRREKGEDVAHLLCELHERLGRAVSDGEFDLPLTQEELADAMGMTAAHTSRVLQRMRKEGMLSLNSRHLRTLQPSRFQEIRKLDQACLPA